MGISKSVKWLITGGLALVGGLLYRLGGYGPPFNTKFRDLGIPTIAVICLWVWGYHHWSLIPTFGLMFAAQTSYFKKKGTDAKWFNWLFVGLAFSLSSIPISVYVRYPLGFFYRTLVVTTLTVLWSQFVGNDWVEEFGRGFIQIITLPILLT